MILVRTESYFGFKGFYGFEVTNINAMSVHDVGGVKFRHDFSHSPNIRY